MIAVVFHSPYEPSVVIVGDDRYKLVHELRKLVIGYVEQEVKYGLEPAVAMLESVKDMTIPDELAIIRFIRGSQYWEDRATIDYIYNIITV